MFRDIKMLDPLRGKSDTQQSGKRRTVVLSFGLPRWSKPLVQATKDWRVQVVAVAALLLFVFTLVLPIIQPHIGAKTYALSPKSDFLLPKTDNAMASKVQYDNKQQAYNFNAGYTPAANNTQSGGAHISATAYSDPRKGISVTDPNSEADLTIKPQFNLLTAQKQQNRIVYPLVEQNGWVVYSMQADQVKEDVILQSAKSDSMKFSYQLDLGNELAAHLLSDGSVGVYGSSLPINGNVSTGSTKDAQLLQKARQNAAKDTLLFTIPAPVVDSYNQTKTSAKAHFELSGSQLTVAVTGLKQAVYPLAIDPSVYVTSAQQFMQGNNETSIDFDTSGDQIQKGKITGARLDTSTSSTGWTSDLALNAARWSAGYATGGGYAYTVGGSSGGTNTSTVYWSEFDPNSNSLETPINPGTGAAGCNSSNWCTNTAYDLPNPRSGLSSVVYNGYLYAVGGTDSSCAGTNNVCSTVYYARLGANGEPISWDTTSALLTGRRFAGLVAYNNHLYVVGGQTNTSLNGEQTTEYSLIKPDGSLNTWATTTSIPTAGRWGASVLQYNGYIYLVGGASTTTAANTIQYIKINSDGSLASSWVTASTFTNARMSFGGNFATIYGGYLYITTGCATLTTTACSTFTAQTFTSVTATVCGASHTFSTQTDFQYASVDADGSLTPFTVSAQNPFSCVVLNGTPLSSAASTAMTGYGLLAWHGALYGIGGCTAVSTATNCSGTTQTQVKYGVLNDDGNVSPVFGSTSSDFYNNTNYLRDLPPIGTATGDGGSIATGVVINNGFIYNVAGCANIACSTMSNRVSYAKINSDGTLGAPTCAFTLINTIWCLDTTHTVTAAIGAMGITVYDNVIYTEGGFTGSANTTASYRVALASDGSLGTWSAADTNGALGTAAGYVYIFARAIPNNATQSYMYQIGGCVGTTGIGCSSYVATVRRCTITNGGAYVASSCTTTGQQQLRTVSTRGGLGIFGGTVYGDYIYLAGGANSLATTDVTATGATCNADPTSCGGQMDIIQYALIDPSGNITRADGTVATGTSANWNVASSRMTEERRRTTAFAINGYLYVVAGHNGTAPAHTLHDIQRGKINVSTGDVTGIEALGTSITDRWDLRAAQANGYIYILGGCTNGDPPASCTNTGGTGASGAGEYIQIYNNWSASPGSYTSSSNRPATDRYGGGATVLNGYLYLAGGCTTTTDCSSTTTGTASTDVSYAQIAADGSIGSWTAATGTSLLPAARTFGRLENVGGTLYYIGGQTSAAAAQTSVYYNTPNPSTGAPSAWSTSTHTLPVAKSQFNSSVYNNRIYIAGGFSGTNTTPVATVYYSSDQSGGGDATSWTSTTSFNIARSGETTVAYGNNLYVMGGFDGTNYLLDVQYAPINSDGTIGTFVYGTSLPQVVRQGDGFASNGFLYLFGGRSAATTCTNNTYDVPINADGSLGNWSQTSVAFTTARWGLAAAYSGGRAFLLGGQCNATLTSTNNTIYGTLQLQPQLAQYSLSINTDTNVFPEKYLANGLDNGIGASWFLTYQSSTTANDTWGQATNAGKITLGTPGTYTPLDAGGTNTNTTVGAQYYFLFWTIDDQNAFGFPEDISRGPTIRDITLEFTSDPGKRLRNGKTFVHGEQQPFDTPF